MSITGIRGMLYRVFPTARVIATVFVLWACLRIITDSRCPIMVVSSASMEPTFYRGDVIILWNRQKSISTGDIPVVWFTGRPLPMVHRAVRVYDTTGSMKE